MTPSRFNSCFQTICQVPPFPWQERLWERLVTGDVPSLCSLPTGLGKTSIIPIWLLALAQSPNVVPRRLVYVVNRRTVVDQATDEARRMCELLPDELKQALQRLCSVPVEQPLAISTLRGQFADNSEWRSDPARPAVVIGTVDMIGSRLLFGGYGIGFKSKPTHAGLLGQDVLLVHDEAHLEPAFQRLLDAIVKEQERSGDARLLKVMQLTATSRGDDSTNRFELTEAEQRGDVPVVKERLFAAKGLQLHMVADDKAVRDEIVKQALHHKDSQQAVLVFTRRVEDVHFIVEALAKKKVATDHITTLTGTMRGFERDRLILHPVFQRFLPTSKRAATEPLEGTVYLVCTSAGEVGVDLSADHLVCDLMPFESMVQRFGRVNRYGFGDALLDVVVPQVLDEKDKLTPCRQATLEVLRQLPQRDSDQRHDASPSSLGKLDAAQRAAAFSPEPEYLATTDVLLDCWALTSIRERMPGRPPVAEWLHGAAEWEPPQTQVAWREEVDVFKTLLQQKEWNDRDLEEMLAAYPLKPHELLRDRHDRVQQTLLELSNRLGADKLESPPDVWLINDDGQLRHMPLPELVKKDRQNKFQTSVAHCTVILPPSVGGLSTEGLLTAALLAEGDSKPQFDVADEWRRDLKDNAAPYVRRRHWDDDAPQRGMRLALRPIDTRPQTDQADDDNDEPTRRYWKWYVRPRDADDEGSEAGSLEQLLQDHLQRAADAARLIVERLIVPASEATAVITAAKWHDLGKDRALWQQSIRNFDYLAQPPRVLAKSARPNLPPLKMTHYRHEFGSLLDVQSAELRAEFESLSAEQQDLVLHLIAAHHGRARPHFPPDEAFDPNHPLEKCADLANETPRRFARLQARYGRWGLAWLESLVRAADVIASSPP